MHFNSVVRRAWYEASIEAFLATEPDTVLGALTRSSGMNIDVTQRDAWLAEVNILQDQLRGLSGDIFFEFTIPRLGSRVDVALLIDAVIYLIEFKVGAKAFERAARDQAWDYALDLKNFHEASHNQTIVPLLVATDAEPSSKFDIQLASDRVAKPIYVGAGQLRSAVDQVRLAVEIGISISADWATSPYKPTPTIVEAARALFANHSVEAIARQDAGAKNLRLTSMRIEELIAEAKSQRRKIICFVTGVPGAGKTLVGLNVATLHRRDSGGDHAVYLSGNGPLVSVLREALTRDEKQRLDRLGQKATKGRVAQPVKAFIQNVHHFRDEALISTLPPADHVVIFDEAQRAWNLQKTAQFMKQKKGQTDFAQSEASFLISYLDRHADWAVIVCLVGGGQEIHTGEAGITAWLDAVNSEYPHWSLYISSRLNDSEYGVGNALISNQGALRVQRDDSLHLAVSMRSFRAERVSSFVKAALDCDLAQARLLHQEIVARYPIMVTRDLARAKRWIKDRSRGSERYGLVASSKAMRLKPLAIDVRVSIDPVHWFLDEPDDVRSSWYLEDCATEFQVQGLELEWTCVIWDADLRYSERGWTHHDFRGKRWLNIKQPSAQAYLKNAYRVLLTRARQGMVIVVPTGDPGDITRVPEYYDETYHYLKRIGLSEV